MGYSNLSIFCSSSSPQERNSVIKGLHGHVIRLMRHKEAALVVETAYNDHATAEQRSDLIQEFYGGEYAVFKNKSGGDMATILSAHPDRKKLLSSMKDSLLRLVDK